MFGIQKGFEMHDLLRKEGGKLDLQRCNLAYDAMAASFFEEPPLAAP